jgi:hypothetical protein
MLTVEAAPAGVLVLLRGTALGLIDLALESRNGDPRHPFILKQIKL